MPGFGDYFFIFVLALILFGPKKLPDLARQFGKLMAEFRRASNEFKMQMEEELRASDRAEQEKKLAALQASNASPAPVPSSLPYGDNGALTETPAIAASGDLTMNAPETGLPVAQAEPPEPTLNPMLEPALLAMDAAPSADAESAAAVNALMDSVPARGETPAAEALKTEEPTAGEQARNV